MTKSPSKLHLIKQFLAIIMSVVFILAADRSAAQDVLYKRDSIRCKILKVTTTDYVYAYRDSNNTVVQATISRRLVDSVKYKRYVTDTIKIVSESDKNKQEKKEASVAASDKDKDKDEDKVSPWLFTFGIGLSATNFLEINSPHDSNKNSLSATCTIDLGMTYKKDGGRFEMSNELHWLFVAQRSSLKSSAHIQRVADELKTLHDFSLGMNKGNKWSVNVIAKLTTSVFTIYKGDYFQNVNHTGKEQGFINPYEVILSPGIKFQPDKYFKISLSPYSMRFYGLESQAIANTGLYTQDTNANHNYVRYEYKLLGAELNIWYQRKIRKWLEMQYRLGISSEYIDRIGKNCFMDGLFITKVKLIKNLSLSHRAVLKGDLGDKPFKPHYTQTIVLSYTRLF